MGGVKATVGGVVKGRGVQRTPYETVSHGPRGIALVRESMEIEVFAVELTGKELQALPKDDRVLLIQLAHLANTIIVLQKWMIFCSNRSESGSIHAAAETTQQMLVMRILSGVLYEGWQMLSQSYFGTQLSKKYHSRLSKEDQECLKTLKCYFRKKENPIKRVRNRFAFHFDRGAVESELKLVPPDARYHFYLSEFQGNSLYYLSEELVGLGMLRALEDIVDATDVSGILRCLFKDLVSISSTFARFIGAWLVLIVRDYLPGVTRDDLAPIHVPDVLPLDKIRIPFFVSKPEGDTLL